MNVYPITANPFIEPGRKYLMYNIVVCLGEYYGWEAYPL